MGYYKLTIETFLHYLLVPLSENYLYSKILRYPNSRFGLLFLAMLLGFITAQILNYSIGRILKIYSKHTQRRNSFIILLEKYYILIIFCTAPFTYSSSITMFFYGFINYRFLKLIIYSCCGKLSFDLYKMAFWYFHK